jgi:excisionase family DNA binding protein
VNKDEYIQSQSDVLTTHYWTIEEIAAQLRVSKMTVYRLVETGEIDHIRVGRVYRIPEEALREYLR